MKFKEIIDNELSLEVKKIPLDKLNNWIFDESYSLYHESKGFFTFVGTEQNNLKNILLFQNEVGLLTIFLRYKNKDFDNQEILLQKKQEPGNFPIIQISPSIQMTYSNLNGMHGGSKSKLNFINEQKKNIIYLFIKHEQSDSFLLKKNLNMLCHYNPIIEKTNLLNPRNNIWLSTDNIIDYLLTGNIIHSDTRSVLFLYFGLRIVEVYKYKLLKVIKKELINKINIWNFKNQKNWRFLNMKDITIYKNGSLYLKDENKITTSRRTISGFRIKSNNREVFEWDQPLLEINKKIYSLIYTIKNNEINILISLDSSNGTWNEVEFLPTSSFDVNGKNLNPYKEKNLILMHESDQSDEGGRFWRRSNKYQIYFKENFESLEKYDDKLLLSLPELIYFYENSNHISMELRSICILLFSFLIKTSWKFQ